MNQAVLKTGPGSGNPLGGQTSYTPRGIPEIKVVPIVPAQTDEPYEMVALRKLSVGDLNRLKMRVSAAILEGEADNGPATLCGVKMPRLVARIIMLAAEEANLNVSDLLHPNRTHACSMARYRAMKSIRALRGNGGEPRYSFPRIGRFFKRDHTTVVHGCNRYTGPLVVIEE